MTPERGHRDRSPLFDASEPPRVTLRSPLDVLALVPYSLGFHPERSLVLLTTTPQGRPFHARVDLPQPGPVTSGGAHAGVEGPEVLDSDQVALRLLDRLSALEAVADHVAGAAQANQADLAIVVAYTDDALFGEVAVSILAERLAVRGIPVGVALRADGGRWYAVDDPDDPGEPYDVRDHPLTAMGVLTGRVTFESRSALVRSLVPTDLHDVEEVAAAAARRLRRRAPAAGRAAGRAAGGAVSDPAGEAVAEAAWFRGLLGRSPARPLAADEVARALVDLRDVTTRDRVRQDITRRDASLWVELLREVVRRTPVELAAGPAGLLAFAAWQAGDGALAWCAVDRAHAADPRQELAGLVATMLERAVPPSAWTQDGGDPVTPAGA
jgi:hypothetical protein